MQSTAAGKPNGYARLVRRLARHRWFAVIGRRTARADRLLYRWSGGRLTTLGPQRAAMPETCLLTTIGRRSGKPRTTPVMFLRDGPTLIVTSENFGQRRAAAWPLNLEANPDATVQIGRRRMACRARALSPEETARHWPAFVRAWPAHEDYHRRSGSRRMFALEPSEP